MKLIIYIILIFSIFSSSCEDFLQEENLKSLDAKTAFNDEKSFEGVVNAAYVTLRSFYGKENGWDFTEAGTDLYTWGSDNRSRGFCTYQTFHGAEEQTRANALWSELYKGINTCNLILKNIDQVPFSNDSVKSLRSGEAMFLRAFYYYLIVETWGDTYYSAEPTTEAVHTVTKTPVAEIYNHIISDVKNAISLLPQQTTQYGRVIKPVAESFLARVYLTIGMNAEALENAKKVINNYDFQLISSWSQLWNLDNTKNDEIIWAVNYSDDPVYTRSNLRYFNDDGEFVEYNTTGLIQRDGGNQGHLMWEIRYENTAWAMVRDIQSGRGFQRWLPTKFFINLFNEDLDQRFYGSFKNTWYCNSLDAVPKWPGVKVKGKVIKKGYVFIDGQQVELDTALLGTPMFKLGDTTMFFSKKPFPSHLKAKLAETDLWYIHPQKGYLIFDINDMYDASGAPAAAINRQYYFPITHKYKDTARAEVAIQYSKRDAYVFRLAEMYLIAAEAAMKSGNLAEAYNYLKSLADNRAIDGNGSALLDAYGVSSGADITIDFILDERARELATENLRFFDLKRTGKLVERVKKYNTDAAPFIKDYHVLRFIPQQQLDAVYNKDEFKQNPGY